jgi:hypothetical protein
VVEPVVHLSINDVGDAWNALDPHGMSPRVFLSNLNNSYRSCIAYCLRRLGQLVCKLKARLNCMRGAQWATAVPLFTECPGFRSCRTHARGRSWSLLGLQGAERRFRQWLVELASFDEADIETVTLPPKLEPLLQEIRGHLSGASA